MDVITSPPLPPFLAHTPLKIKVKKYKKEKKKKRLCEERTRSEGLTRTQPPPPKGNKQIKKKEKGEGGWPDLNQQHGYLNKPVMFTSSENQIPRSDHEERN